MASSKINIDLVLNTKGFRPLGRINGQLGEFEKSLDASNARVLAFGASAGAILAVRKAFTATVKAAIEVEKSLQDINVILQATSANLKKFGSDLFQIASQTGQSFQVAAQAAAELARQGLGTEETLKRTRDALILARLSGMGAAEAVNSLTAAINTFNKAGLDSTVIINKLANVDAAFAVSSDDLAKALGRVGSSAQGAGVSLDQLLAIVTTVQQKTARGGAVIGNSFKTIFTRIQRPRVIQELENLGIAVRDVEGDVLPAIKVLNNLAKQFDHLSQSQRSQISELVGGVFQVNILKAAMSDLSKETGIYNRALDISLGSSDQALRRNEELNKTLSAQFNRTVNTFKEGAAELGQLTFAPALENLFGIVDGFEKLGDTQGGKIGGAIAKSIFEGIGQFISGPGLLIIGYTLFKTFSQLGKFAADAFKTLTGLNKNFQTQLNLQKQIFNVLDENPDLLRRIKDGTLSVEDAHEEIYKQISKNTSALEEQLRMSQRLAQGLQGGGVGFSPDFGAFTGPRKPKFGAASGYTPNFADEVAGMMASGYSRSQIKNPKVRKQNIHDGMGGSFTSTVNGHEDIINTRNSMGKKATFVVPPRNTDAYKNYMSSLSSGFIPNFTIEANPITQDDINTLRALKDTPKVNGAFPPGVNEGAIAIAKKLNLGKSYSNMGPKAIHDQALKKYNQQQGPTTGYGTPVDLSTKGKKGVKVYDAKGTVGLLGLYGKTSTSGYVEAPINKITEYSDWMNKLKPKVKPNLPGSKIGFKNVEFRSLTKELEDNKQKGEFSKLVRSNLAGGMEQLAQDFSTSILGNDAIKPASIKTSGGALFSTSAEGNIFETAVNALTASSPGRNRAQAFEAALAADEQQVWDFEERGNASSRFKNAFSFNEGLIKADAKRTLSRGAGESMVNKIFNPDGGLTQGSWVDDLEKAKASVKTAANGFIPNFSALFESVRREKEAGVPAGRIRVGQSDRLKSGANPAGIGVYNTRDEPMGLNQGINNSVAAGMDPKKQGRAGGFIPNFQFMKPGAGGKGVPNLPISVPLMLPEKVKNELVNTFTRAFEDGQKVLDGPGSGGMKDADAHVIDAGDGSPSGAGADKIVKATEENTASMKSIARTNRDNSMKTVGALMVVQQASTGLQNMLGETNAGLKDFISEIGDLATTIVGLSYASDQLQQRMTDRAERIRGANPNASSGDSALDKKVAAGTATERELSVHDAMLSGQEKLEGARERAKARSAKAQKFSDRMTKRGPKIGRFAKTRGFARRSAGFAARTGASAMGGVGVGAAKIAGAAGKFVAGGGLLAAGAAVAGLKLIGDLGKKWSASNQELEAATKALARQKEETEKNIGHLNKFGTAAQQAADVFENQNASMAELSIATKAMDKAMLELPAEMRAKLGGIIDPKRVNSMIESMVSKEQDRLAQVQKRADSAKLMEEAREKTGFFDVLSGDMTFLGFGKGEEQQKQDDRQVQDLGKSIISSMVSKDPKALEGVDVEKIVKMMSATTDADERVAQAKELGLEGQDLASFQNFVEQGGKVGEDFVRGLTDAAVELKAELELQKKLKPIREAILRQNKAQQKAVENLKKTLESEQRVRKAVNKIYEQGAKSFLTEVGKISLDEISKLSNLQADTNKQFGTVITQSTNALGTAMEGGGLQGTGIDAQVQNLIRSATTQGVGSVGETEVKGLQDLLDKQIEKLGDDKDNLLAEQQVKELQGLKVELDNLRGNSERLNKDLKDQTNEIKEQTAAQKAVARQQQRLRSFGGTQALLDPSKLNATIGQIQAGSQAMSMSAAAGSSIGFSRGRLNQLKAMQDLMGGSLPENVREEGLKRAEEVKFSDMQKLNNMNKTLGGPVMTDDQMRKAAQEQAASMFKGDNPTDRNTAAIESLTKAILGNEEMVDRSAKDVTAVNEAQNITNKDKAQRAEDFRSVAKRLKLSSDQGVDQIKADKANLNLAAAGGTDDIASMLVRGELLNLGKLGIGQMNRIGLTDPDSGLGKYGNSSDMKFLGMHLPGQMSAEERIKMSGRGRSGKPSMVAEMEDEALQEGQKIINNKTDIKFEVNRDGGVSMTTGGDVNVSSIDGAIESLQEMKSELKRHKDVLRSIDPAAYGAAAPTNTMVS